MNKLVSVFSKIDDSRGDLTKLHELNDILLIGIISVICGADSWNGLPTKLYIIKLPHNFFACSIKRLFL